MNRLVMMIVGVMAMVIGCGGAGGGTGGDGGSTSGGTGGSAGETSNSGGSGGSGGTTATTTSTTSSTGGSVETCGASVPKACQYPEDALGFDPGEGDAGPVYPYPGAVLAMGISDGYWWVRHDDGTEAPYDADELRPAPTLAQQADLPQVLTEDDIPESAR